MAKVVYDFAFGREQNEDHLNTLLASLPTLDLTHSNPCWRYYQLTDEERDALVPGLSDYLPPVGDGANRDIGGWDSQEKWFRFGAKHNDIFPIIGDMLRWSVKLPSRHASHLEASNI